MERSAVMSALAYTAVACGLGAAQQPPGLGQPAARREHPARRGVPEPVRGARPRTSRRPGHGRRRSPPPGPSAARAEHPGPARWPVRRPGRAPVAQVPGQRPADVGWQGHLIQANSPSPCTLSTPDRQSMSSSSRPTTRRLPQRQPQHHRHHRPFPTPAGSPARTAASTSPSAGPSPRG